MRSVQLLDRLLEITVLLEEDLTRALTEVGLTIARTHLLWELRRLGASTQQRLAVALGVSPRNVTGLVDALEATGFVLRGAHPTDRRATLVTLTERGERTMTAMEQGHAVLADQLVEGLSVSQLDDLGSGLDALATRLRALVGTGGAP